MLRTQIDWTLTSEMLTSSLFLNWDLIYKISQSTIQTGKEHYRQQKQLVILFPYQSSIKGTNQDCLWNMSPCFLREKKGIERAGICQYKQTTSYVSRSESEFFCFLLLTKFSITKQRVSSWKWDGTAFWFPNQIEVLD
jgi:hypothetical protein